MRNHHSATTLVLIAAATVTALAQSGAQPVNDPPNPYQTAVDYLKLPEGRSWGSTSAVEIDRDGRSVWVAERCGATSFPNGCFSASTGMSTLDPILKFDPSGKLVKSFGSGMVAFPHGIYVDREGNVWVTDGADNAPQAARGGGAGAGRGAPGDAPRPLGVAAGATLGHQVFKFSPDGKLLLTIGKPGGTVDPNDCCYQPNDVVVLGNGDIIVSQGHGAGKSEILQFTKDGKLIKRWGKNGSAPGDFSTPHAIALDSAGRLFVGDRGNNRIQVFDPQFNFVAEWPQFSRPSGVYIRNDMLYVADSESASVARDRQGWLRGIRMGSVKDGKVTAFIPDPDEKATGTSAAEGVAVDAAGVVYGAEVGPHQVKRYVRK
jgi:DNA-binding beta-propeller fold protein YncE